jgi:hypothetical protein
MAVRGKPVVQSANLTTLLAGPFHLVQKNAHSAKPVEFYNLVEKLCPAPRFADLFSRYRHNERWDCHGDEAPPLDHYDASDDFAKSIEVGYAHIRERVAKGGPPWTPREPLPPDAAAADDDGIPAFLRRSGGAR